jgi:hypothetical protein
LEGKKIPAYPSANLLICSPFQIEDTCLFPHIKAVPPKLGIGFGSKASMTSAWIDFGIRRGLNQSPRHACRTSTTKVPLPYRSSRRRCLLLPCQPPTSPATLHLRATSNSPVVSSNLLWPHTLGVDLASFLDVMHDYGSFCGSSCTGDAGPPIACNVTVSRITVRVPCALKSHRPSTISLLNVCSSARYGSRCFGGVAGNILLRRRMP